MNLLIISDCHGVPPPWSEKRPDAILLIGDNAGIERLAVRRYPGVPAFGVPGNHDDTDIYQGLPVQNLHGRAISFNGLRIGGLGGCLQYKSDPFLFTEREYAAILAQIPPVDVFISHCPPAGAPGTDPPEGGFWGKIKDCFRPREFYGAHEGSGALRQYILKKTAEAAVLRAPAPRGQAFDRHDAGNCGVRKPPFLPERRGYYCIKPMTGRRWSATSTASPT